MANKAETKKKIYLIAFSVFIIFGTSAILGAFLGKYIDDKFGIAPYGNILILVLMYFLSWFIITKTTLNMKSKKKNKSKEINQETTNKDKI